MTEREDSAIAYASWSVVFGEQPSASKWNILGTNDAEFNSLIQRNGTGVDILDSSGLEVLKGATVASAVNEVTATSAATGNAPSLSATGGDTNVSLNLVSKGTGTVQVNGSSVGSFGAWTSWTPTWTNLTVGNATQTGKYMQIGKLVIARLSFTLGTTSSVGAGPSFTLPVTSVTYLVNDVIGKGIAQTNGQWETSIGWLSTTTARPFAWLATGTYVGGLTGWSSVIPGGGWSSTETFGFQIIYEAA